MTRERLRTARLRLRELEPGDAPRLHGLDSDPEVMRYLSKGAATPLARIEHELLPRWLEYYTRYEHLGFFAAELAETGEFLGWFHLRPYAGDETVPELGYRLKRAAWGRGLATEGARALVEAAFAAGFSRVAATTLAANLASRRVLERSGFTEQRRFHYAAELLPDWAEDERAAIEYAAEPRG
jgi:RimJ/RimL family protein N-acetyltransferase